MNYHPGSERKFKKIWLILSIIIAITIIFLISSPLQSFLRNTLHYLGYPFWQAKSFISQKATFIGAVVRSRAKLVEDNNLLREELTRLKLSLKTLPFLEEENSNLKTLLGREALQESLPAKILARPPQTFYDVLIIDVGKNSQLEGGEVVYFESVVLGVVEEVYTKTSKVKLYSSSGVETQAFVERTNLPVLVKGRGGGNFEAKLPQEALIEEGDFLTVSGDTNRLLGQVGTIETNPIDSFKRVLIRYPINLSEIRWLAVEIQE